MSAIALDIPRSRKWTWPKVIGALIAAFSMLILSSGGGSVDESEPAPEGSSVCDSTGTQYYVLDGGSGSGTSWSDAADQVPTAPTRGVDVYVADGTYSGRTFTTAASGTTEIRICKATESNHGTDTGWSSAYGDGVATFSSALEFNTDYWVLDGATGGGPGSWTTDFGIKINAPLDDRGIVFLGSNITVRHFEIEGDGGDGDGGENQSNDLIDFTGGDDLLIEYSYLHDSGRTIFFSNNSSTDIIVQYTYTGQCESTAAEHSELASLWGGSGNFTFRWNFFTASCGTGGLMFEGAGYYRIHGNIFYNDGTGIWESGGNGLIGGWNSNTDPVENLFVYNNTFIGVDSDGGVLGNLYSVVLSEAARAVNLQAANNLFYTSDTGPPASTYWDVRTHNHFVDSGATWGDSPTSDTGDPFVDYVGHDFGLDANTTAGTDLGSTYNVDMLGNTRTTWTRGAIEYAP